VNDREHNAGAVQSRLTELVRKFIARTEADVVQMRDALTRLDAGPADDKGGGLTQIHHLAHRICGTSGTLGLMALSDAAADLERCIEGCAADTIPGAAERTRIAAGIDRIAALL
jgi:HPt (histidine-containing phosphotransfer) domain-containing protein